MRLLTIACIAVLAFAGCAAPEAPFLPETTATPPASSKPAGGVACDPPPQPVASPDPSAQARRSTIMLAESTGQPEPINGTLRLCLGGEYVAVAAGPASCSWDAARTGVRVVTATLELDGVEVAIEVSTDAGAGPGIAVAHEGGRYAAEPATATASLEDDGLAGSIGPVQVTLQQPIDAPAARPLGGPAGPQRLFAVARWACLPPGPPAPGVASGELTFRIASPVERVFTTGATCTWSSPDGVPRVDDVEGYGSRAALGPDRYVAAAIRLWDDLPEVELYVTRSSFARYGDYGRGDTTWVTPLHRLPDSSSGRAWVRNLELQVGSADESHAIDGVSTRLAVDVTWRCAQPVTPPLPGDGEPPAEPQRAGRLSVDVRAPIEMRADGVVQCGLDRSPGDGSTYAAWATGVVDIADEQWVVDARGETFVILRLARDGRVVGEYARRWSVWGNDVDTVVLRDTFLRLAEPEPPGVISAPLGSSGRPDWIAISFEIDCRPR